MVDSWWAGRCHPVRRMRLPVSECSKSMISLSHFIRTGPIQGSTAGQTLCSAREDQGRAEGRGAASLKLLVCPDCQKLNNNDNFYYLQKAKSMPWFSQVFPSGKVYSLHPSVRKPGERIWLIKTIV